MENWGQICSDPEVHKVGSDSPISLPNVPDAKVTPVDGVMDQTIFGLRHFVAVAIVPPWVVSNIQIGVFVQVEVLGNIKSAIGVVDT